jgi:hypothetical protein
VVGYKVGMLTGGSLFVWASATVPWQLLLALMGAAILAVLAATLAMPATRTRAHPPRRLAAVVGDLVRALRAPSSRGLLWFLVTYKLGETMATAMWKPFLVDAGFDKPFIGQASGFGMAASIAGSLAGGWLASRFSLFTALMIPAAARVVPLAGQALVALRPEGWSVLAVTCAENLLGGALTTVVFATMMARVDRRIGASHYTALAAIEVAGKLPAQFLSGPIATALGYPSLYAIAAAVTVALLPLALPLRDER